jgi:iron complex outermembrane receptor protein
MELSGFYNSPTIYQASSESRSQWSTDIGLKMKMLNGSGNLALALSDVFKTNRWIGEIHYGALDLVITNRWDSRRLKVNFSYLFGNKKLKKTRNRKTGLDDEKKRTK